MLNLPSDETGVLPNDLLQDAIEDGVIDAGDFKIPLENVQPASLDLRLGPTAYRLQCSFLPGARTVSQRLRDFALGQLDLRDEGVVLDVNRPYLIPLKERLDLPDRIRGMANPKSSTGRADVFTRLITDHGASFDVVKEGYQGNLYLEVVPLSFPIRVQEDLCLNQLRLSVGQAALSDEDVRSRHDESPILFAEGKPVPTDRLSLSDGLFLGLDLKGGPHGHVGYRARGSAPLLDLTRVRAAEPESYWDPVGHETGDHIILEPNRFYLLMSFEAVSIPPTLSAEMSAYDPTSGELRTHYAGFFDPGFGYDRNNRFQGSTAALEIRAHDVPFVIEHRQRVCKLTFARMLKPPTVLYGEARQSNYQQQTNTLGKHFRTPRPQTPVQPKEPRPTGPGQREASGDQLTLFGPEP